MSRTSLNMLERDVFSVPYSEAFLLGVNRNGRAVNMWNTDVSAVFEHYDYALDLRAGALKLHTYRAVVLIAHPAGRAAVVGSELRYIAEYDYLHPAVKHEAAADNFVVVHALTSSWFSDYMVTEKCAVVQWIFRLDKQKDALSAQWAKKR